MNVGLVVHAGRQASLDVARTAARLLSEADVGVVVTRPSDPETDDTTALSAIATPVAPEDFAERIDVALSLGGDGTFLRAAHLCRDANVPVLGVNLGRLGFLAEVEVDVLEPALNLLATGEYRVEERPTLEVEVRAPDGSTLATGWAFNEVSVEKTARQRLLHTDVYISKSHFARVPADAVLVATPTGSTAYALSAGGPIVSPRLDAMLVVPVAPHSLFDRTVVVGPTEQVRIELLRDQAAALVSCDGRDPVTVDPGGSVLVRGGGLPVRIARTDPLDFYGLVREKFGLR